MRRAVILALALAGCGASAIGATTTRIAHWRAFVHVSEPVDVVGPRSDGSLILAVANGLATLAPGGAVTRFASAYRGQSGEPYLALSQSGCFGGDTVYALKLSQPQGVFAITPGRKVRVLATLRAAGLANGIAFDSSGRFGHRLLATVSGGGRTTVYAISCHGNVHRITTSAPTVEGGIVVAPSTFGSFAGDLIAPDELTGRIWAITPSGRHRLLASSGLPAGQDTGVESLGFLPRSGPYRAFMADRATPGNPHPGDNEVLELDSPALAAAGAGGGDLLAATEGGALVDAISCIGSRCSVSQVAAGPRRAHGEGHIAVVSG